MQIDENPHARPLERAGDGGGAASRLDGSFNKSISRERRVSKYRDLAAAARRSDAMNMKNSLVCAGGGPQRRRRSLARIRAPSL